MIHLRPFPQLALDVEHINIDITGSFAAAALCEFKSSDTTPFCMAHKPSFLESFLCGHLMGGKAGNRIALGNDPASAASCCHEAHLDNSRGIDKKRQRTYLMQFMIPQTHG